MVNDPTKTKGAVRPIKEFDVIEVSKFKLKQITGIKLYHYIVFKEWPKLIKETTFIIGSPKEFTEFREEQTNGESTHENTSSLKFDITAKEIEKLKEHTSCFQNEQIKIVGKYGLTLIKDLSNIIGPDWQIRARINKKGKIVTHAKGQLFKIDLIDD